MQLRSATFPFLALLICQSERTVQIADKVQGYVDDNQLIERVTNAMPHLEALRSESRMRNESSRLRDEQDRAYRASEEADRRNREMREQEEMEARQRQQEEKNQRELADAIDLSNRLTRDSHLSQIRLRLDEEPPLGPDISSLRFQLPKGVKISRRFRRTDKVQKIFDYLEVHFEDNGHEVNNFSVGTNFPKKNFEDMESTIEAEGLHPRGMLFVIDLDA